MPQTRIVVRLALVAGVVVFSSAGYSATSGHGALSHRAGSDIGTAPAMAPPPDRQHVIDLSKKYFFWFDKPPVELSGKVDGQHNHGVPKSKEPKLRIARARQWIGTHVDPTEQILALITSDKEGYSGLGIANGRNFVWRDKSDKDKHNWHTYIVPEDASKPIIELARTNDYKSGDSPDEPRLVLHIDPAGKYRIEEQDTFAACLSDPVCDSGHCGYNY